MKKTILLFIFVATTTFTFGQKADSISQKIDSIDCSSVTKKVDDFSGEITFRTDIVDYNSFTKVITKEGIIVYYLSLRIKESGIYTGTGVTIILKNGTRINKPNQEVGYTLLGDNFYVTAFFRLTAADIVLLKESGIEKYKLYISTADISAYSDRSKDRFNCLVNAK